MSEAPEIAPTGRCRDLVLIIESQKTEIENLKSENDRYRVGEVDFNETIKSYNSKMARLERHRVAAVNGLESTELRLQSARSENEALKDQLFRLQPIEHISDAQIRQKYDTLCDDISGWVECEFMDVETPLHTLLEQVNWKLLDPVLDRGLRNSMERYDSTKLTLLTCIVHRFIGIHILRQYAFAADNNLQLWLTNIENGMNLVEPRKEKELIAMWRADTIRAIFKTPEHVAAYEKGLVVVSKNMWDLFKPLFPRNRDQLKAMRRFHERITKPAAELAKDMRATPENYRFAPKYAEGSVTIPLEVFEDELDRSTVIDARDERQLKVPVLSRFASSQRIGEQLCVVHPSLVRRSKDGRNVTICKATILVKVDAPAAAAESHQSRTMPQKI